jgi:hypothetical protein
LPLKNDSCWHMRSVNSISLFILRVTTENREPLLKKLSTSFSWNYIRCCGNWISCHLLFWTIYQSSWVVQGLNHC